MAGLWPQNGREEVRLEEQSGDPKSPSLVPLFVFFLFLQLQLLSLSLSLFFFSSTQSTSSASFSFLLLLFFRSSPSLPLFLLYSFVLFPPPLHAAAALWPDTIPLSFIIVLSSLFSFFQSFFSLFSLFSYSLSLSSSSFQLPLFIVARSYPDLG